MNSMEIRALTEPDMVPFLDAVTVERTDADWHRIAVFIGEVQDDKRAIWAAWHAEHVIGMITLRWQSDYGGFRRTPAAPEIIDLYVWHTARRQGLATHLLRHAEDAARDKGFGRIGLGIGVGAADAPALGLYLRQGYRFDGTGGWWNGLPVGDCPHIDQATAPILLMMDKTL